MTIRELVRNNAVKIEILAYLAEALYHRAVSAVCAEINSECKACTAVTVLTELCNLAAHMSENSVE